METDHIVEMADKIDNLHNQIMDAIRTLKNAGGECNCNPNEAREPYKYIHEGNIADEVQEVCLHCGGMIVWKWNS